MFQHPWAQYPLLDRKVCSSWPQARIAILTLQRGLTGEQGSVCGLVPPSLCWLLQVDKEKKQVTVEAGILLTDLHPQLDKYGLAMSK